MKKITSLIISILLLLNFLASPFYFINIKEKAVWLKYRTHFRKRKVAVDSVKTMSSNDMSTGLHGNSSQPTLHYLFYYGKGKFIDIDDASNAVFHSDKKALRAKQALNYFKTHNDSLLIWYHPIINGKYALEEETEIYTEGYLTQIIINSFLLCIALYSSIWQIKEWRKPPLARASRSCPW